MKKKKLTLTKARDILCRSGIGKASHLAEIGE